MNPILEKELAEGRFYREVEFVFEVPLESADKLLLKEHLSNKRFVNFTQMYRSIGRYLWEEGFRSETLKRMMEKDKKVSAWVAETYLERYRKQQAFKS